MQNSLAARQNLEGKPWFEANAWLDNCFSKNLSMADASQKVNLVIEHGEEFGGRYLVCVGLAIRCGDVLYSPDLSFLLGVLLRAWERDCCRH